MAANEYLELDSFETDAAFVRNVADMLDAAPRFRSGPDHHVIVMPDELARAIADALRTVHRRSLAH